MNDNTVIRQTVSSLDYLISSLLKKIDYSASAFAFKTCLALAIGYGLAFWLNFSASTTAITILVLSTRYLGSSLDKAILRIAGTLAGAVLALFLVGIIAQERFLFIFVVAILNAVLFYIMQGSRYPYSWFVFAMTLMIVGFGSIENPDNTFHLALSRTSGVMLGIASSLLVHSLLWPSRAGLDFEKQLRSILNNYSELPSLKYSAYFSKDSDIKDSALIERNIISGLPKIRATLDAASSDTGRFSRFQKSYSSLINQVSSLANLLFVLSETFKNCSTYPSLKNDLQQSKKLDEIIELIVSQLRKLVIECDLSRDGTANESDTISQSEFRNKLDDLTEELRSKGLDLVSSLAFSIMKKKLEELEANIIKTRSMLLSVEKPGESEFFNATQPEIFEIEKSFNIKSPRFIKSVTSALIVMLASIIWIVTDWPLGYSSFLLFAWGISYVNIVSPVVPTRQLLSGFVWGAGVGSLVYFIVMPQLDNFLQLAPIIILMFFPFCYKLNSQNPLAAAWGMLGAILLVSFANIANEQTYSFSTFVNIFIGAGGGLLMGMILLGIFSHKSPEKEFKKQMISFFGSCESLFKQVDTNRPWTEKGRALIFSSKKELLNNVKISSFWGSTLNYERTTTNDKNKVNSLLSSNSNIIFRIDALLEASQQFKDESIHSSIKEKAQEMHRTIVDEFSMLQSSISNGEPVPEFSDLSDIVKQIRADIEVIRDRKEAGTKENKIVVNLLLMAGFYQSLTSSLNECRDRVNSLNWETFDETYF